VQIPAQASEPWGPREPLQLESLALLVQSAQQAWAAVCAAQFPALEWVSLEPLA